MMLTIQEVALLFGVSTRTIRRLWLANKFPEPRRIGRSIRWHKQELLDWIKDYCPQCVDTPAEPQSEVIAN